MRSEMFWRHQDEFFGYTGDLDSLVERHLDEFSRLTIEEQADYSVLVVKMLQAATDYEERLQ